MKRLVMFVLMLCLTLSGAPCYANGLAGQENKKGGDGTPIILIQNSNHCEPEKGNTVFATINSHMLTVVFLENLGQVTVEITTSTDSPVDFITMSTPNGYQYYIPNTGDYIVTFTLENGDEYYGEFTVTD